MCIDMDELRCLCGASLTPLDEEVCGVDGELSYLEEASVGAEMELSDENADMRHRIQMIGFVRWRVLRT